MLFYKVFCTSPMTKINVGYVTCSWLMWCFNLLTDRLSGLAKVTDSTAFQLMSLPCIRYSFHVFTHESLWIAETSQHSSRWLVDSARCRVFAASCCIVIHCSWSTPEMFVFFFQMQAVTFCWCVILSFCSIDTFEKATQTVGGDLN